MKIYNLYFVIIFLQILPITLHGTLAHKKKNIHKIKKKDNKNDIIERKKGRETQDMVVSLGQ